MRYTHLGLLYQLLWHNDVLLDWGPYQVEKPVIQRYVILRCITPLCTISPWVLPFVYAATRTITLYWMTRQICQRLNMDTNLTLVWWYGSFYHWVTIQNIWPEAEYDFLYHIMTAHNYTNCERVTRLAIFGVSIITSCISSDHITHYWDLWSLFKSTNNEFCIWSAIYIKHRM